MAIMKGKIHLLLQVATCLFSRIHLSNGLCHFPSNWTGTWFQSGEVDYVKVNSTTIESRGNCVESDGDRFLIEDRSENCYRCLVISQKHYNILQFKETYCLYKDTFENLCLQIPGDAPLMSMFRIDAKPISCPFKGGPPFTFTYNRGSGECRTPVSRVDACTDDSRMLFRYQACPDVITSESAVEELVCLAAWQDGPMKYLVGRLEHKMISSDEERYRCFIYGRSNAKTYELAQSADATCNGISSPTDGSRTMKLTKLEGGGHVHGVCKFPSWLSDHHIWHSLDHSKSYHFSAKNGTLRVTTTAARDGEHALESRAVCNSILVTSDSQMVTATHVTVGCQSGYTCMAFYRRDGHVVEIQQSAKEVQNVEEACAPQNFNPVTLPYTTLITPVLHKKRCPYLGRYIVTSDASNSDSSMKLSASAPNRVIDSFPDEKPNCDSKRQILSLGCGMSDTMEFHSECNSESVTGAYTCHGDWTDENDTSFLIAVPKIGSGRYCFVIRNAPPSEPLVGGTGGASPSSKRAPLHLQVASLSNSCRRDVRRDYETYWTFNITRHAECDGTINGSVHMGTASLWLLVLLSPLVTMTSSCTIFK